MVKTTVEPENKSINFTKTRIITWIGIDGDAKVKVDRATVVIQRIFGRVHCRSRSRTHGRGHAVYKRCESQETLKRGSPVDKIRPDGTIDTADRGDDRRLLCLDLLA